MFKLCFFYLLILLTIHSCSTVIEPQSAPKSISYNGSKQIVVKFGQTFISSAPIIIDGGLPIVSYIIISTLIPEITLNQNTGVFTIDSNLAVGDYYVYIKVTNSKGDHTEAIKIIIEANPASNLIYNPNTLSLKIGTNVSSTIPRINNGGSNSVKYHFKDSIVNGFLIDSFNGVITATSILVAGTYNLNVSVKNSFTTTVFNNALTVTVLLADAAPSGLNYSPNTLTLESGNSGNSVDPSVQINGSAITSYNLLSAISGININTSTGAISVNNSLAIGNYPLNISVTNGIGTTNFNSIYTVIIKAPATAPVSIAYSGNSLSINQGSSNNSNIPSINDGGTPITQFELVSAPSGVSINSQGRLLFANTIAVGSYQLSVKLTNSKGSTTFNNVFTLTILAHVNITYSVNIAPLISNNCSCHTDGSTNPNLNSYNGAKNNINSIISETASGSMPKNGSLTDDQKNLFTQWKADGLLQN